MHRNLRQFIDLLEREKELAILSAPVDPYLEIAEIHRRVIEEGGPALLFTNVKGSSFPVITNLFGTSRRMELAFGTRPEELVKHAVGALERLLPPTPLAVWKEKGLLWELLKVGTKTAASAPILAASRESSPLEGLPALTCWQEDGGPFVSMPLVYTESPVSGASNLGMYRMQIYDDQTTGMHWQKHKGGGYHYSEAQERGEALPVTVFLGGPPALIASAVAPVPEMLPEILLASLILGEKIGMAPAPDGGHRLIAEAEFAIRGKVPPHLRRPEGPFGDPYGYYSLTHDFPVLQVERVYHRKDAVYPATIVGKPRQEDYYLGEYLQRLLSPTIPLVMPGVRELWTYAETGFHPLAAAIVRESYRREALGHAFRILGEGQLSLTKLLLVTDQPVRLDRFDELLQAVLERFDPEEDLIIITPSSHDTLDDTGHRQSHGSKAILLGVGEPKRKLPGDYRGGVIPGIRSAEPYCPGCLVVSGAGYSADPELSERLATEHGDALADWPLVILTEDAAVARDQTAFLWTVFTRFNPAADLYARTRVERHHLSYRLPLVIDARMKPGYPEELFPREDIVKLVGERWKEYFPHV
ncbi:UbiD family decarboxylase [Gorillibacterium timonense]|uniref:UbiD family decarboxylase n=1 Tax=Gorillibacterium timonense TaxID=1689269 RepID=UPI00071E1F49|nr:UbiD family decarboxylase [Gorillibacterium timonense]